MSKTGGGPYSAVPFTNLEERVVAAASIEAQLAGVPNVKTFGVSVETPMSPSDLSDCGNELPIDPPPSPTTRAIEETLQQLEADESQEEPSRDNLSFNYASNSAKNVSKSAACSKTKEDERLKAIKEEIESQKEFQGKLLNILRERNEIEIKKVSILESQAKSDIQYRKMKVAKIEIEITKINFEIDLLKPKV